MLMLCNNDSLVQYALSFPSSNNHGNSFNIGITEITSMQSHHVEMMDSISIKHSSMRYGRNQK